MPHIPHGPTDAASLVPFEPALEAALRPSPDYDVSRWLYVPNTLFGVPLHIGYPWLSSADLRWYQPLHRRAGRAGPHAAIRRADCH